MHTCQHGELCLALQLNATLNATLDATLPWIHEDQIQASLQTEMFVFYFTLHLNAPVMIFPGAHNAAALYFLEEATRKHGSEVLAN